MKNRRRRNKKKETKSVIKQIHRAVADEESSRQLTPSPLRPRQRHPRSLLSLPTTLAPKCRLLELRFRCHETPRQVPVQTLDQSCPGRPPVASQGLMSQERRVLAVRTALHRESNLRAGQVRAVTAFLQCLQLDEAEAQLDQRAAASHQVADHRSIAFEAIRQLFNSTLPLPQQTLRLSPKSPLPSSRPFLLQSDTPRPPRKSLPNARTILRPLGTSSAIINLVRSPSTPMDTSREVHSEFLSSV